MKNILIKRIVSTIIAMLYIIFTYYIYLLLRQGYVFNNCEVIAGGLNIGYMEGLLGSGFTCFGYYAVFERIAVYIYFLFLWISLLPLLFKRFTPKNSIIFIIGIIILILIMSIIWAITPLVYIDQLLDIRNN